MYDVMGRRMETLVHEDQKTGAHALTLPTAAFSPGVYYYMLTAGKNRMSRTMVVIQ